MRPKGLKMTTVKWTPPDLPETEAPAKTLAKRQLKLETSGAWEEFCQSDPIRAQLAILIADAETRNRTGQTYMAETEATRWISRDLQDALGEQYPGLDEVAA
jgi:hypothetical protein